MTSPKRQHFIPQSYLKNFATKEGDKSFVEAMNVHNGEIKYPFSIKDICVSKNIYTIPKVPDSDKYALENYYATNVDNIYPDVYRLLTNDQIEAISNNDREKILSTALSLYFRTSKFLNLRNAELDKVFSFIDNVNFKDEEHIRSIYFGDRNYSFNKSQVDQVKEDITVNNKIDFIVGHFKQWQDFVRHKYHSQITVCRVTDEIPLITCDNPVSIYNHRYFTPDIFDPNNSIQLPLDRHYFLWISPNSQQTERNIIYRGVRDKWFAFTSNHTTQTNATDWIIGNENTIAEHLKQQKKHNEIIPENIEALDNIKIKSIMLTEYVEILQKHGMHSEIAIARFKDMQQNPIFQEDPMFQKMEIEMRESGLA